MDGGKTLQAVANGRTGTIEGDAPTSVWMTFFILLLVLAVFLFTLYQLRELHLAAR